jgi:hypothetical protein
MKPKGQITLTDEQLGEIDAIMGEIPSKYILPLIVYLQAAYKAQNGQQTDSKEVEVEG